MHSKPPIHRRQTTTMPVKNERVVLTQVNVDILVEILIYGLPLSSRIFPASTQIALNLD